MNVRIISSDRCEASSIIIFGDNDDRKLFDLIFLASWQMV
jgi:hypothetical protein